MGTPAKRMITVSRSSGSGLVPTPANRMIISVSRYSGSGLVPTPANKMITVSGSSCSGLLPTIEQNWQTTQNPLSSDLDIFHAISEKIRHLEEIPSAFYEQMIWKNKEAVAKDPEMKKFVWEFIDTILDTSNLCNGLAKCLSMEKTNHDILEKFLQKVSPAGSPPLDEAQLNKIKEKLRVLVNNADRDPFEDLQQQFKSLLDRYEELRKKLEEKIKKLSGKRKAKRVWRTVSGSLMAALAAAAAITCVVVVVVAPPTAVVIGTALSLYATSMGSLGKMMLSSRRKEQNLGEAEQLAEKVLRHSFATELDLKGINIFMKGLNRFRAPIVEYVKTYLKDHDVLDLADIAMPIRRLEEQLLPKLDDLVNKVDGCLTKLTRQIEDLKKPLL